MKHLLITIFTVIALAACGGADERKAAYLEKAKQSLKVGDIDKARIELKNVLQIDPKHADAYFHLGKIHEGRTAYRKAFANYNKASELDPDNSEYLAKLGGFHLLLAGDIDKATELMEKILNKNSDDNNGLLLKASILLKQGKDDKAQTISEGIYKVAPDNLENVLFLSALHIQNKKLPEAIKLLDDAYASNPNGSNLAKILAQILFENKEYDRVENIFKDLLNKQPDSFDSYLNLASLYQNTNELGKAETLLKEAIQAKPEDSQRQIAYATFVKQTSGTQKAISVLKDLIKQYPDNGELRLSIAQLYLVENDYDNATDTYKTAIDDFSDREVGIKSRLVLAAIDLKNQDVESSEALVDKALEIAPGDSGANLLKAKIALIKEDTQQAILSLRTVTKDEPDNVDASLLLAKAHNLNNEKLQADSVIQKAYDNNRTNLKGLLLLSQYHLKNNNIAQAEKIIDNCLAIDEDNYEALTIKAGILTNSKKHSEAKQHIDLLLSAHSDKENGYFFSVSPLLESKQHAKAIELLEEGYRKTNYSRKILITLTKLQVSIKEYDAAIDRINNEISMKKEEDAELYMALSGAYMASGNIKEYENNLKRVIQIKPDTNKPYILLSKFYINNRQTDKAMRILKDGLLQIKDDYAILLSIAGLHELSKDYDSAINTYEDILNLDANQLVAINNLAALLSEHRSDTASLDRAKELAEKLKDTNQPVLLDTVGWVHYKTGNYTDAVSTLELVVEKAPDNAIFNYHLGMAYYKTDKKDSARTFLSKALSGDANFAGRSEAEKLLKSL